ncbi:unnamed protein product [Thlaspi arvense]|uniref:FBD domain-containing protein n=1 Tax=Thlaspi arvense TaxID=13288 RepID=A0AAU9SCQ1_THLAR|nr:unnamed protein product [Thlaspi arvense]
MDFVDRVLAISPVHKVSLKCRTGVDSDRLDFWIGNVLARGASDLDLRIVFGDRYWPSPRGFESRKLVKLNLDYLLYSDFVAEDYPLVNFQNLSEARIYLKITDDQVERARFPNLDDDEYDDAVRLGSMPKLMSGLRNVETLYLNSTTLEVLSLCCESMPVFNNLKFLAFWSGESQWQAVPVLLKKCPRLETLSISGLLHHVTDACGDVCDCIPREDKGRSLTSCPVKRIEIECFIGTMREITMINHFLDYFPCLMEIVIAVEEYSPTQLHVPEIADLKAQMLKLYNKSVRCNVKIMVCESLLRKLTAQTLTHHDFLAFGF